MHGFDWGQTVSSLGQAMGIWHRELLQNKPTFWFPINYVVASSKLLPTVQIR